MTHEDSQEYFQIPAFEYYYHEESKKSISLDNYYNCLNEAIDLDEGYGNILRPVFIVLLYSDSNFDHIAEKFVKNQKYWHAAIGFGPSLSRTYSFNFGEADANKFKGGLSFESLNFYKDEHPTGTMEVSCILLTKDRYTKLKSVLEYYIRNKEKTKYDFVNLLRSLFGKSTPDGTKMNLVCSTFVDTILKSANINLTNMNSNLVKPDDLRVARKHEKQFKLYSGKISGYDINKIADRVDKLTSDENNDFFKKIGKKKSTNESTTLNEVFGLSKEEKEVKAKEKHELSDLEFSYDKKYNAFCLTVSNYSIDKLEAMLSKKTDELNAAKKEKADAGDNHDKLVAQIKIDYLDNVCKKCASMIQKKKSYH